MSSVYVIRSNRLTVLRKKSTNEKPYLNERKFTTSWPKDDSVLKEFSRGQCPWEISFFLLLLLNIDIYLTEEAKQSESLLLANQFGSCIQVGVSKAASGEWLIRLNC